MPLQKPERGGAADAAATGSVRPPEERCRTRVAGSSRGGLSQKQQRDRNKATQMLLQNPQRGGAADAGSSGSVQPPEERRRVRVSGSISGRLSQKQQQQLDRTATRGGAAGVGYSGSVPLPEERHRARFAGSSSGGRSHKQQRDRNTATPMLLQKPLHGDVGSSGSEERPRTRVAGSSSGLLSQKQQGDRNTASRMLPQKSQRGGALDAGSSGSVRPPEERCRTKVAGSSSGRLSQKQQQNKKTATVGSMPRKQQAKQEMERSQVAESGEKLDRGAMDITIIEKPPLQETDEIQKLKGEDISPDDFLKYLKQLPDEPSIDLYTKIEDKLLAPLYERHARYRLKYLKFSPNASKDKLYAELKKHNALDLLEEDFSEGLLSKMRYFEQFETDGSLGWFFDPELCRIQALDDYQRLVLQNHGGFEYAHLDQYCKFFYDYETGQEYLDYCEELSKKLKWMEEYVLIEGSSLEWEKIRTRGAFQAIKIATGFLKITGGLASIGFYECLNNMRFHAVWLKDLDNVYFEVWLRVIKQKKSFRNALEEVYELDKFPSRQDRIKCALENENDYSRMEMEFSTCMTGVTSDITEDKARELIAEAIKKLEGPLYEHYVRKKIAIAQSIGLITKKSFIDKKEKDKEIVLELSFQCSSNRGEGEGEGEGEEGEGWVRKVKV